MEKEWNLSDEEEDGANCPRYEVYSKKNVKEFIRRLKELSVWKPYANDNFLCIKLEKIDKLSGSKLSGEKDD